MHLGGTDQTMTPKQNPSSGEMKICAGRFHIKSRISGGSFGDIYRAVDNHKIQDVAIKLEPCRTRHAQLNYESRIYNILHRGGGVVGIPEIFYFGIEGEWNAMVMELCGPSLEDLFNYCCRQFTLKTILMLADQMLHRMEFIHTKTFVHRDLKPENFVMGLGDRGHHVMLIDFGLSKKYWDSRTRSHIPYRDDKPLTGTARYCSANTHKGIEVVRRDDLESIGFILVYFFKGQLPWQGIQEADPNMKTTRIGEKKLDTSLNDLCDGCPDVFLKYLQYCRGMRFDETPNYSYCRNLFSQLFEEKHFEYDWVFDWVVKRQHETEGVSRSLVSEESQFMNSQNPLSVSRATNLGQSMQARYDMIDADVKLNIESPSPQQQHFNAPNSPGSPPFVLGGPPPQRKMTVLPPSGENNQENGSC